LERWIAARFARIEDVIGRELQADTRQAGWAERTGNEDFSFLCALAIRKTVFLLRLLTYADVFRVLRFSSTSKKKFE
jgi:hypothetical protein